MRWPTTTGGLLLALLLILSSTAGAARLDFTLSYQGVLSGAIPVDVAQVSLGLDPGPGGRAELEITTAPHAKGDWLYPLRLCYRSFAAPNGGGTAAVNWWSLAGGRQTQGWIQFDRDHRLAVRVQRERKIARGSPPFHGRLADLTPAPGETLDEDRGQAANPAQEPALDRLGMLLWLREQPMAAGLALAPPVLNGLHLTGYRIQVEAEEQLEWHGAGVPTWRVRLEPQTQGGKEERPLWVWIGRDAARWPLRFQGHGALGSFELRLIDTDAPALGLCPATTGPSPPP